MIVPAEAVRSTRSAVESKKDLHSICQSEMDICRKLSQENGGRCNWGVCDACGVIPLLHKLATGKVCEDGGDDVQKLRSQKLKI